MALRCWRQGLGAAVLLLTASAAPIRAAAQVQARSEPVAAWVQLVDGGAPEVRALIEGPVCPEVSVDGDPRPMHVRIGADPAFAQAVCSLMVPKTAHRLSIAGHELPPPPPARIDRLVVIGDTGCRIHGSKLQSCNDPRAWPFALIARRIAAEKPDLVIHVGDYYYRETVCPASDAGCADSPHGDIWSSWAADFFDPARPLLDAAPWVFARGNHEDCARGGKGWFRMLDAAAPAATCREQTPVFNVPIGSVTLHVFDSADAEDRAATPGEVAAVAYQIDSLPHGTPTHDDWIITHRPFWGEAPAFSLGPLGVFNVGINRTEQLAARGKDLSAVSLILSGHVHHFASFDFGDARPAQLVVGTGGDIGETFDPAKLEASEVYINGLEAETLTFQRFGYFVMERTGAGWTGLFKDLDGKPVARCTLVGRALRCSGVR